MLSVIGTLNEGALHAQLKEWYREPGDMLEQKVGGYVIDLVRGDLLVEFQTGGFAPLRTKLAALAEAQRVRLVAPVAATRRIVRVSDAGEILSSRRSPRRGCVHDVFDRLVSIPALVAHPNFEIEVLLTHQDELRMFRPGRAYRRRGWVVVGRSLVSVEQSALIGGPSDLARLLPELDATFDTAELAAASCIDRRLAQRMAYCLRAMDVIAPVGKRGGAVLYARTERLDVDYRHSRMVTQTRHISPRISKAWSGLNVGAAMPSARPGRPAWSEPSPQAPKSTSSL